MTKELEFQQEAKAICDESFGGFASIHSSDDLNDAQTACSSCCIGLNDIANEGTFVWDDGTAYDWTNGWLTAQPDNSGGNEHCGKWQKNVLAKWFNWMEKCSRQNTQLHHKTMATLVLSVAICWSLIKCIDATQITCSDLTTSVNVWGIAASG